MKKKLKSWAGKLDDAWKRPFRNMRADRLRTQIPLKRETTQYVAHRGLSGEAPENTVRAFEMAGDLRFQAMETDIRRTKDNKLVLMHDASLRRMCDQDILVKDVTYNVLKQIPIIGGNQSDQYEDDPKAQYVPLLSEYLVICRDSGMVPMMELKDNWNVEEPLDDDYLSDIICQVKEIMGDAPVIFVSFNLNSLIGMQRVAREEGADNVSLYHLVKKTRDLDLSWYKEHGINLSIQGKANKLSDIRRIKKAGISMVVWTVDNPDDARLYIREGVDWVASNYCLWS
ncbi:MAG: hypothetical protein IJH71_02100 [Eubacterium sp.]|nr:hypothetical protein [Eubacterium sp.]